MLASRSLGHLPYSPSRTGRITFHATTAHGEISERHLVRFFLFEDFALAFRHCTANTTIAALRLTQLGIYNQCGFGHLSLYSGSEIGLPAVIAGYQLKRRAGGAIDSCPPPHPAQPEMPNEPTVFSTSSLPQRGHLGSASCDDLARVSNLRPHFLQRYS